MKKILYLLFLFTFSIVITSFFIVSCENFQIDSSELSQTKISKRSQQPNYVSELTNNCGPELYPNDYDCGTEIPYTSQTFEIETESGCTVLATMTIQECYDETDDLPVLFMSELSWDFDDPVSEDCKDWIKNVLNSHYIGQQNSAVDELNEEIENAFIEIFMLDWTINNGSGVGPINVSTAYFKASCLQRCFESNQDYFNIIDQPCAEYGCCMKLFSIDVPPADTVIYWGNYQLSSCSNYFQVTCRIGDPLGNCRFLGCN